MKANNIQNKRLNTKRKSVVKSCLIVFRLILSKKIEYTKSILIKKKHSGNAKFSRVKVAFLTIKKLQNWRAKVEKAKFSPEIFHC